MNTLRILFLLISPLLLLSCEKQANRLETKVSGRVVTNNTDDFPGDTALPVELVEMTGGSGLGVGEKVHQTQYTDANGHFSFTFTAKDPQEAWSIRLPDSNTPPLHSSMTRVGVPVKVGQVQNINIELAPHAWIKLHVKNINPQPGDLLSVNWGGGMSPNFYGSADDTIILRGGGNIYRSFPLELFRNNTWHNFKDSAYLPAFDTTYHLLEY